MAEFPALPLWTDSYLADTLHLSDAEHGLYLRLLMLMWRSPECRIPNDDDWLARQLRKTHAEVAEYVRPLIKEFCQSDGNWITQRRLLKERDYVRRTSKAQSVRAKSGWQKRKVSSPDDAARHQSGNAPTPTPTPLTEAKASSGESPPDDLKAVIFGKGLEWLGKQSGRKIENLRPMVGRWCAQHGDGRTLEAMREAQKDGPVDPVAYIEKILAPQKGLNGHKPIDWERALANADK